MGSADVAGSPSFTLERVYRGPKLSMHHFDFYRLHEGGIVGQELAEAIEMADSVVVVEWGDVVHDILPAERIVCNVQVTGENSRRFSFSYPDTYAYLFEGVTP
jgi:tRNA threonylcarbamoyladenosine biosynthesis protein TsaE